MTKGRKTTYEERIAFVKECIENECNYTEIAQKHQVGYQQIYTWVQKYQKDDEDALKDGEDGTRRITNRRRKKNGYDWKMQP